VTSVKWKAGLIVTCADDTHVMIWNAARFELLHAVHTEALDEWHTLTYVALEPGPAGHRVVAVTQNGYAVSWDATTGVLLSHNKVHAASIEGLAWNPRTSLIATCSSDCSTVVFTL
jgi:WD40 repeat protein